MCSEVAHKCQSFAHIIQKFKFVVKKSCKALIVHMTGILGFVMAYQANETVNASMTIISCICTNCMCVSDT